jgi:hypothetical protein
MLTDLPRMDHIAIFVQVHLYNPRHSWAIMWVITAILGAYHTPRSLMLTSILLHHLEILDLLDMWEMWTP